MHCPFCPARSCIMIYVYRGIRSPDGGPFDGATEGCEQSTRDWQTCPSKHVERTSNPRSCPLPGSGATASAPLPPPSLLGGPSAGLRGRVRASEPPPILASSVPLAQFSPRYPGRRRSACLFRLLSCDTKIHSENPLQSFDLSFHKNISAIRRLRVNDRRSRLVSVSPRIFTIYRFFLIDLIFVVFDYT